MFMEYNYLKKQRKSIHFEFGNKIKNSKPHSNKLPHNSYILIIPKNVVQLSGAITTTTNNSPNHKANTAEKLVL